jgi:predicted membrane chloride channel (bestrophin family)
MVAKQMLLPLLVAATAAGVSGFAPQAPSLVKQGTARVSTELFNKKLPPIQPLSYGEESRMYRRTVYSHDDWVKHRSSQRFLRQINAITASGVYKNIGNEIFACTAIATFIVVYNNLTGGYTDFDGVQQDAIIKGLPLIGLPLTPFTLASPSLGLLLAFRTNQAYKRWDEARKNWGMNINHTRDLVRMANAFYDDRNVTPEKRKEDLKAVSLATWSFVRAMKRHLSPEKEDEEAFRAELHEKLPAPQASAIINAAHRPNRALFDLSIAIENLPMHFVRRNEVHTAVTIFEDNLGSSERLLTSPVPLFYSRHTARFVSVWLLLMPFALWEPCKGSWNHIAMVPAAALVSLFLYGIDELATQMEEPFTILPMQAFCDKIYNWCNEIVSWEFGDNGMPVKKSSPIYDNEDMSFFQDDRQNVRGTYIAN